MGRYLIFCVLIVVCLVQISRVVCIPEGYRERLNLPATIQDVQTMTVGETQELLGERRTTGTFMPNRFPTAKNDDDVSTVEEKRVVENEKDDLKSTTTKRDQVHQDWGVPVKMEPANKHREFQLNQTPSNLLLQAIAAKESFTEQSRAHITPAKNEIINVETKEPANVVQVELKQQELTTESPAHRNQEIRSVVNNMMATHDVVREMTKLGEVKGMPDHETVNERSFDGIRRHELVRQMTDHKGMPIHGGTKEMINRERIRGMLVHKGMPIHGGATPSNSGVKEMANHGGVKEMSNHGGVKEMSNHGGVKEMSNHGGVKEVSKHGGVKEMSNHGGVQEISNHGGDKEMSNHGGVKEMSNHETDKELPNREEIKNTPNHKGISIYGGVNKISNNDGVKLMPNNYQTIRDFLSGKDISASLEGLGMRQLPGFDGTKGNVRFDSKVVKPAFGDKEVNWVIKVQQVVFSDGDDENLQASKSGKSKSLLSENIFNRINNGLDVFGEIFSGNKRRHLLQIDDKDNLGASTAGKETEKDKSSPSSDSTDTTAEGTDDATSGKLTPDSPNQDSTLQKTMPEKGEASPAQDQPPAKPYGGYDMLYPFRQDLQMDGGGGPNLKRSGDFFSNQRVDPRVEDAVENLKRNYMVDLLKNRVAGGRDLDYGNKNDDDGRDDEHFNELIRGGENDQREFKSAREARLMKRSVRGMLDKLPKTDDDDSDSSLYKRSVHETNRDNGVLAADEETSKDSPNSRLHKRSVHVMPDDYNAFLQNDIAGSVNDSLNSRYRRKRSVHAMPGNVGRLFSGEKPGSAKVSRLFKRAVPDIFDEVGESVNEDNVEPPKSVPDRRSYGIPDIDDHDETLKDQLDSRLFKRSVREIPGYRHAFVNDGSEETAQDSRLHKRSLHDMPRDGGGFVNDGNEETAKDSRLHKRSAQDIPADSGVPVDGDNNDSHKDSSKFRLFRRSVQDLRQNTDATPNDDNEESPKDPSDPRLFKRSVQDLPRDNDASDGNEETPEDSRDSRLFKRSVQDLPRDNDASDGNEETPEYLRDSRLFKRSVQDLPRDNDASDGKEETSEDPRDSRLFKRSVQDLPRDNDASVGNEETPEDPRDSRLFKRSVQDLPRDNDASANDDNEETRNNPRDPRLFKRSVDDVSGKYGVSVNDDDGSPKEYDIEIDNGVKHARFPTEEKPLLVKRDVSGSGSEAFGTGHQHNSQENGFQHRHNNTWSDGAIKEAQNIDLNKIHRGENGGKIFASGDGSPTLVGLVLIPVNRDGTIKEDKEPDSASNAQYHHLENHHRRPCNGSHGHHGPPHNADHTAGDGNTHPCHHGHHKSHHHRHRPMEHHVVGRTDSQQAQNYPSESHTSYEDQRGDSHSEKHSGSSHHHSAHKGDYEKEKPHSESPGGFHNRDGESHQTKEHHGEHGSGQAGGRRGEMIVETIRTEQITSGHAQRSAHPGNAVHVLVILSIFLICFTVILFLVARSRSGGHVREINSRTALYVPQAKY